ncbi:alpha/beta hydrolase [Salinibacterium sp. SYSU T00001]|uniref:alpha/beta fold hydrolase n=1 Tax=Homoserinimonas sedimenticola TaxID=2986805 RepID=UPI0022358B5D|nr:alpha/beta hydrolase [Salinibacterium sedimenticola]MCW4385708.1 alpha/beta hydrolase [Salinibacterium sedimenticola]
MRPAVILVHGLRTSHSMWRHQVEALGEQGIPTLAIDLPGHGRRIGERFTLDGALSSIGDAVAAAEASDGTPYLVGFSLGGYVSIEWVARNPGRVSGLLAAACSAVPHPLVMHPWRAIAALIGRFPDRGLALNNLAVRMFIPEPGATDVISGGVALDVMDDSIRALLRLRPIESLRRIGEPVLFVNGRWDHVGIHARRYLAATRNGRLVTIPGASHVAPAIRPREFTRELLTGYHEATQR